MYKQYLGVKINIYHILFNCYQAQGNDYEL